MRNNCTLNIEDVEDILSMLRMRIDSYKDWIRTAEQHPEIEAFQDTTYTALKLAEHEALEIKMKELFNRLLP